MPKQDLGRVRQVPLSDVFANEPQDFTPWLADNLDLVGSEIRLDLELEDTEVPVGDFFLDILASAGEFGKVAIENQLSQSDHGHLGQLMTYAAGLNARTLVWVAPVFRSEHLAAIDSLNEWAASNIILFAVEVRALKIGESLTGADFRVVAAPKAWARRRRSTSPSAAMTDSERSLRIDFFDRLAKGALDRGLTESTGFASVAKSKSFPCRVDEPGLKYWVDWRTTGVVAVQLDVRTGGADRNEAIIQALFDDNAEIEHELSFEPDFFFPDPDGPHGRIAGRVMTFRDTSVDDPPDVIEVTLDWCLDRLEAFQRVLEPRLRQVIDELDSEEA
ncbi:MAG: hypothetical protein OXI41_08535 [Chloroflexota bacterium]|nr:hypothetical protein [Chloroflexota bacterium]MDE2894525.1 hypothetical protein [Chloroflexota bacterium]